MGNCVRKPVKCAHASSSNFPPPGATKPNGDAKQVSTSPSGESSFRSLNKSLIASKVDVSVHSNLKSFSFTDLKNATKNFRSETMLGEGGFGCVFKGWIDLNTFAPTKPGSGVVVAVKKLKPESCQGHKEWLTEVTYLGQLHHENLVKLIGYCSESDNRLLVYEFMPKGSLEQHLFRKGVQPIAWTMRMNIAIDVARGLSFLHGLDANVIYRDLKASNVLLDSDYNAKLSDFGLARDGPTGDKTHVSTKVLGTRGYAAPEYVATGHLTPKSDVYSYGVVLLELLSGRRAMEEERGGFDDETLVDWAKPFLIDSRRVLRIMDTRLGGQYPKKAAQAAAALALQCLHTDPKNRPLMIDVLATLEKLNTSRDIIPRTARPVKLDNHGIKPMNSPYRITKT
ncbi:PREDICTED: protein kinase 2A, chloroplastic-like [Populus euphratica]|uniref:non-specific serine/threonine protein kinase n=1 Tax=Populus euphratica TaxID=75702 RepID=A0AAJ6V6Q9_POPEU|nr:PREDICTED: protein kinase 2A, chloroplastic-like [Populus euphratica]